MNKSALLALTGINTTADIIAAIRNIEDIIDCHEWTNIANNQLDLNVQINSEGKVSINIYPIVNNQTQVQGEMLTFSDLGINDQKAITETITIKLREHVFIDTPPLINALNNADGIEIDGTFIREFNFDDSETEWLLDVEANGEIRELTVTTSDLQSAIKQDNNTWVAHTPDELFTITCFNLTSF